MRAVIYDDHQGGYIDNVPSTFTRSNNDLGNVYFNIAPDRAGICPNGLPAGGAGGLLHAAERGRRPTTSRSPGRTPIRSTTRARASRCCYQINDDWDVLITESLQSLDAEGMSVEYPIGSDFQPLAPLQVTSFTPSYDKDNYANTAWTVNGKIGALQGQSTPAATPTGTSRSRWTTPTTPAPSAACTTSAPAASTGFGRRHPPTCFSPLGLSGTTRSATPTSATKSGVSTPDDWRIRGIVGAY